MRRHQTAEDFIAEAIAAPDLVAQAKASIPEKAQLYSSVYLIAFAACLVLLFYAGWFRWVAGFFVAACLVTAWSMRGALAGLQWVYATLEGGDSVLHNHQALNYFSLGLLTYALFAVWAHWPVPAFAVFIAAAINFLHYTGYRGRQPRG